MYFALNNNRGIIFVLKDISIILSITSVYIIEKLFKIRLNERIKFIYIVFIFMAHFLGIIVDLYTKIYWYDKLVHFISGIVSGISAVYILVLNKENKLFYNILFIISISMLVASIWEIFEYLSSYYVGVDPQKVLTTGVSDTMGDIIVALLGSMLVSLSYYFEHKENHKLLIKKFENLV